MSHLETVELVLGHSGDFLFPAISHIEAHLLLRITSVGLILA